MSFFTMPSQRRVGRPPVRGHEVKKDISMLMRLTKGNYLALSKGQE